MPIPVMLCRQDGQDGYAPRALDLAVQSLFTGAGLTVARSTRVLVKPNLVAARGANLSCTHPQVVRAVCQALVDMGASPWVADSPGFGTAERVAAKIGLAEALSPLGINVRTLGRPAQVRLSAGGSIGVSRDALDADLVLSLAKLKAHSQLGLTLSVKNLFGCVAGHRKALAHSRLGDKGTLFESMILDVAAALPRTAGVVDGVMAMSRKGPINGEPCRMGLLGCSTSIHGLDTAVYGVVGASPEGMVLWREAKSRGLAGSRPEELVYPGLAPCDFAGSGFMLPDDLVPVTFNPVRLITGRLKSLYARFR